MAMEMLALGLHHPWITRQGKDEGGKGKGRVIVREPQTLPVIRGEIPLLSDSQGL